MSFIKDPYINIFIDTKVNSYEMPETAMVLTKTVTRLHCHRNRMMLNREQKLSVTISSMITQSLPYKNVVTNSQVHI